jgi:septum formation protein
MHPQGLILASTSPRRRSLLEQHGYVFELRTADVDELQDQSMDPSRLVELNARLKTLPVAALHPGWVVLGADTVVALGSKIFGKPASMTEAVSMLEELNGREHSVYSGVCLVHQATGKEQVFVERTSVRFRDLSTEQRLAYLERINPLDKAGAYAAQDDQGELIEGFEGSFTNIIGLPMEALVPQLAALGVHPSISDLAHNPQSHP